MTYMTTCIQCLVVRVITVNDWRNETSITSVIIEIRQFQFNFPFPVLAKQGGGTPLQSVLRAATVVKILTEKKL